MRKDIYTSCSPCSGTGIEKINTLVGEEIVIEEIECRTCSGEGIISMYTLSDDFIDFLNDLKDKVDDIKDKVNDIFETVNE